MKRVTVSLSDEQFEALQQFQSENGVANMSEFVRDTVMTSIGYQDLEVQACETPIGPVLEFSRAGRAGSAEYEPMHTIEHAKFAKHLVERYGQELGLTLAFRIFDNAHSMPLLPDSSVITNKHQKSNDFIEAFLGIHLHDIVHIDDRIGLAATSRRGVLILLQYDLATAPEPQLRRAEVDRSRIDSNREWTRIYLALEGPISRSAEK